MLPAYLTSCSALWMTRNNSPNPLWIAGHLLLTLTIPYSLMFIDSDKEYVQTSYDKLLEEEVRPENKDLRVVQNRMSFHHSVKGMLTVASLSMFITALILKSRRT